MKTTSTIILSSLAATAFAATQPWQVRDLKEVDSTSAQGISHVEFTFENPDAGVVTNCTYANAPGSGRLPTVQSYTPCKNQNVRFTYERTSDKTANIAVEYFTTNAAGNVQGVQNSTVVVDLVSSSEGTATDYTSEESELFPGAETGT